MLTKTVEKKAAVKSVKLPKPLTPVVAKQASAFGHTRPKAGGNCARCWEILDSLYEKSGRVGLHGGLMEQLEKEHIPFATGRGQIWRWKAYNGIKGRVLKSVAETPKIVLAKKPSKIKMPKIVLPTAVPSRKAAVLKSVSKAVKLPKPPVKKSAEVVTTPAPEAAPAVLPTEPTTGTV